MKRFDKEFWEMLDVLVHASEIAGQRERWKKKKWLCIRRIMKHSI